MTFPLLFVFLGVYLNQTDSVVLTSSPLKATEGEYFTLICSSNANSVQDRQWCRNVTSPVFTTTQGSPRYTVSNSDIFNKYLSGRVNVSCDATQHNVSLRINSTIDNGSRWQCVDNGSNRPRSNTLTIYVVSETSTSTKSNYHNTASTTTASSSNNYNNTGRPVLTSGSTTTTTTNNNNAHGTSTGQSETIAIAVGAAGGGVAVITAVIVAAVSIRKRRRSVEENVRDKSRHDRNPSRSADMLIDSEVTGEHNEKAMMDNILYTSSSEVLPAKYSIQFHNQADKDVYTEVKKVKTNADQHEVTDMYAKPHKKRKETSNRDMYAQVNKVKSREGTSENIEDMYAKPQKDKRNVKSNADTD